MVHDDILDAFSNVVDILGGDTADRDSSVLCHVNTMLLDHSL